MAKTRYRVLTRHRLELEEELFLMSEDNGSKINLGDQPHSEEEIVSSEELTVGGSTKSPPDSPQHIDIQEHLKRYFMQDPDLKMISSLTACLARVVQARGDSNNSLEKLKDFFQSLTGKTDVSVSDILALRADGDLKELFFLLFKWVVMDSYKRYEPKVHPWQVSDCQPGKEPDTKLVYSSTNPATDKSSRYYGMNVELLLGRDTKKPVETDSSRVTEPQVKNSPPGVDILREKFREMRAQGASAPYAQIPLKPEETDSTSLIQPKVKKVPPGVDILREKFKKMRETGVYTPIPIHELLKDNPPDYELDEEDEMPEDLFKEKLQQLREAIFSSTGQTMEFGSPKPKSDTKSGTNVNSKRKFDS
jgi:hypothetical protein